VRIYYEDTDAGGVVYHANYLNFFERARTEMLRHLGFEQDQLKEESEVLFAVRSLQIDYLKPAKFNDFLNIVTTITDCRKTWLMFEQTLMRHDEVLCQANVRIACIDAHKLKPKPIPPFILEKLT
jgi:acyl-CoA thioester hydrolase